MHLGPERLRVIIDDALTAGTFVVCHDTLTYGDFPDYGPAAGGFTTPLHADMRQKQEAIAETALPGSRQERCQPPGRSWNSLRASEPRPQNYAAS